jgi:hypothetical protein
MFYGYFYNILKQCLRFSILLVYFKHLDDLDCINLILALEEWMTILSFSGDNLEVNQMSCLGMSC